MGARVERSDSEFLRVSANKIKQGSGLVDFGGCSSPQREAILLISSPLYFLPSEVAKNVR